MQSGEGAPTISLQLVPKILAPLVSLWVPNAFVVSFKLETDENLLITKSRDSLNKYKHKVYVCMHEDKCLELRNYYLKKFSYLEHFLML